MNRILLWLRPSRWGVRIRSAVTAALVVGVVLLIAAGAMLGLLRRSLTHQLDTAADTRTTQIADELRHSDGHRIPEGLLAVEGQVVAVQVIAPDGQIAWRSAGKLSAPLTDPRSVGTQAVGLPPTGGYDDDLRVAARTANTSRGDYTILVAANTESVEHAMTEVAVLLAMGGPLVVLAAAAATYLLVGRSLRSVEAIRSQVARIGATALSQRVPVPVARDEIARLADTMNEMLARVEAGHRAQQRFVGDASHELRSPLATITAALELARDRPQALDRDLIEGALLPETERMRQLVENLLTLAAADEHGLELRTGEVDLDDLAAAEAATLRLRGDVWVHTAIVPVRVIGDRPRLARVLRNIADNAAAHARARVSIELEGDDTCARIVVDDDGPGIAPADRERVFGRFVRLDDDRARSSGGSGLGLAIVSEIVAAHGGSVTVGESPWGGARFVLELPVAGPVGVEHPVADPA
ncbi:sensor histidine kinase [Nocardia jiangxiensis]|uniref:histidine kinase n=1 Tax=Nocardia jiangxiensis TaxID=282685 RepID=A0ABW6S5L7_9NOCA|nr:HAMP domain-containing sensor histidine kinase [Nocardia jiangxiensis]